MPAVPEIPNDGQLYTIPLVNQHGGADDWQYPYELERKPKAKPVPVVRRRPRVIREMKQIAAGEAAPVIKTKKPEVISTHCSWCGARYRYGIHPRCAASKENVQAWRERRRSAELA